MFYGSQKIKNTDFRYISHIKSSNEIKKSASFFFFLNSIGLLKMENPVHRWMWRDTEQKESNKWEKSEYFKNDFCHFNYCITQI